MVSNAVGGWFKTFQNICTVVIYFTREFSDSYLSFYSSFFLINYKTNKSHSLNLMYDFHEFFLPYMSKSLANVWKSMLKSRNMSELNIFYFLPAIKVSSFVRRKLKKTDHALWKKNIHLCFITLYELKCVRLMKTK